MKRNSMEKLQHQTLMHKVLSGLATSEEVKELKEWLAASQQNERIFQELSILYHGSVQENGDLQQDQSGWIRLNQAINRAKNKIRRVHQIRVFGMAAVTYGVILMLCYLLGLDIVPSQHKQYQLTSPVTFQQMSLREVIVSINSSYHFQISYRLAEIEHCTFTGSFRKGTSIRDILLTMTKASGVEIFFTGPSAALIKGNCTRRINPEIKDLTGRTAH